MSDGIEHIGRSDIIWSYAATVFQVGAGVFLLPVILTRMSSEAVGLWNIFLTVSSLVLLLDFGFRPSFSRNISYIFSGVTQLQREGVGEIREYNTIDYSLLRSTIRAMQRFYRIVSFVVFFLLMTLGMYYFMTVLDKYSGNRRDALVAWVLLCAVNCYELYTYYYDALLTGKGYIKRSQQIMILSRCIYLGIAIPLVLAGGGLTVIVLAQFASVVVRRIVSYRVFFNSQMREKLCHATPGQPENVLRAISPNAVKVGLTYLGGFLVNKSTVFLGSLFLTLTEVAVYGITLQVMDVLTRCGTILTVSYTPVIAEARAERDIPRMRQLYMLCTLALFSVMLIGGFLWLLLGEWGLTLINCKTHFLPASMLLVMLVVQWLEKNHVVASLFIQADNRIPFYIPSLLSGTATVLLMWFFLSHLNLGLWSLLLAPGIAQAVYQNWRWPLMIIQELYDRR